MLSFLIQALISLGLSVYGISRYVTGTATSRTYMVIVAGILWLIYDIYQLATSKKNKQQKETLPQQEETFIQEQHAATPEQSGTQAGDDALLPSPKSIKLIPAGAARSECFQVFLNGNLVGETDAKNPLVFSTSLAQNVLHVETPKWNKSLPFFFEVIEDGSGDGALYIGFDNHGNLTILLSAGMVFGDTVKGIRRIKKA